MKIDDISENKVIPRHIGIIMDGNGRWAKERGLPRNAGHKKGAQIVEKISDYAAKIGIEYLTVYAFSTENFARPKQEIDSIFSLMRAYVKKQKKLQNKNARLRFLGDMSKIPEDILSDIKAIEIHTQNNTKLNFNIAFNYGGRQDILQAAKQLAEKHKLGEIAVLDDLKESDFEALLYTGAQPELDLIIRTSGEQRLSNFLIWQAAYAELVFMPEYWPDFDEESLDKAIEIYNNRNRRKGGI